MQHGSTPQIHILIHCLESLKYTERLLRPSLTICNRRVDVRRGQTDGTDERKKERQALRMFQQNAWNTANKIDYCYF